MNKWSLKYITIVYNWLINNQFVVLFSIFYQVFSYNKITTLIWVVSVKKKYDPLNVCGFFVIFKKRSEHFEKYEL